MLNSWVHFGTSLLDTFLQDRCALCQRSSMSGLCEACQRQISCCQLPHSHTLGTLSKPGCQSMSVLAWGAYQGSLKQALAALKYNNRPKLATHLGLWLANAWLKLPSNVPKRRLPQHNLIVVPIPLHAEREHQRGYNQATLLAKRFCQVTGLSLAERGLERVQATTAQHGLSETDRDRNLAGAFAVSQRLPSLAQGRAILLLDDIYTSGATMHSAAKALQARGLQVRGGVAVARAIKMLNPTKRTQN
jgi:ComF family protein